MSRGAGRLLAQNASYISELATVAHSAGLPIDEVTRTIESARRKARDGW